MTVQSNNGNGTVRRCVWIVFGGGTVALVLAIAGWVFSAGAYPSELRHIQKTLSEAVTMNANQEHRLIRLETMYERTGEDIREIKSMLKDRGN